MQCYCRQWMMTNKHNLTITTRKWPWSARPVSFTRSGELCVSWVWREEQQTDHLWFSLSHLSAQDQSQTESSQYFQTFFSTCFHWRAPVLNVKCHLEPYGLQATLCRLQGLYIVQCTGPSLSAGLERIKSCYLRTRLDSRGGSSHWGVLPDPLHHAQGRSEGHHQAPHGGRDHLPSTHWAAGDWPELSQHY